MSDDNGRDGTGRFIAGNTYGKGRPRRAIESDYLKALSDALTLDTWREICAGAIEAAKAGDAKAREWLSRYALGVQPATLTQLATDEALGLSADALIDAEADVARDKVTGYYLINDAREEAVKRIIEKEREAKEEAEREMRRQQRQARKAAVSAPEASQNASDMP